jgi:hypothetical protein
MTVVPGSYPLLTLDLQPRASLRFARVPLFVFVLTIFLLHPLGILEGVLEGV